MVQRNQWGSDEPLGCYPNDAVDPALNDGRTPPAKTSAVTTTVTVP